MNFIIIHGIYGNPQENWFPWLKKELEDAGYEVIVPKFPTPINQSLESWLLVLSEHEDKINEDTVMIGHSLGTPFILNYLEKTQKKIKAAYFVAGYHKLIDNKFYELNKDFVYKEFNWEKIKSSCGIFFVFASDNDEYIPLEIPKEMAEKLNASFNIVHDGGHLNSRAGFNTFPLLMESILIDL